MPESRPSFRGALRHRDYRWLASAFTVSNIGSWAYNVALMVWVFNSTGSAVWAGAVSLARFVPALLFSAYGGVLAERFERRSLIVTLYWTAAATHVLMALIVGSDGPIVVALVLAALGTMQGTIYEPAIIALTPEIVGEKDLAAANSLNSLIDNSAIIAGPAIGALLLMWFDPSVTILINAATFVYAAAATRMVGARSQPSDVTEGGRKGPLAQMAVGMKALAGSSTARLLAGFSVLASFFYGTDTVLLVVVSETNLGTGAEGFGYLLTALGVGGIIASPLVGRLGGSTRLGTVIAVGMIVYTLPTAVMVLVDDPAVAFILQVVRGAGTLIVDVLALTAMQRTLPPNLVARVYGVFIALVLAAISLGAAITPALLTLVGLNGTLLIYGLAAPMAVLLGYPRLRRVDRLAKQRLIELQPKLRALESSPLFAVLGRANLEHLAAAATEIKAPIETLIIRQGDQADALYLIEEGTLSVTVKGEDGRHHPVTELVAGDYFGEIALLDGVRRNADVRVVDDCRLYKIDRDTFLSAVGHHPGTGFLDRARHRTAQTMHIAAPLRNAEDTSPED
jgi:MFS family permease